VNGGFYFFGMIKPRAPSPEEYFTGARLLGHPDNGSYRKEGRRLQGDSHMLRQDNIILGS